MSRTYRGGNDGLAVAAGGDRLHATLRNILVTWSIDDESGKDPEELSCISVAGLTGLRCGAIAAHPQKPVVFIAAHRPSDEHAGELLAFNVESEELLWRHATERRISHVLVVPAHGLLVITLDGKCFLWDAEGGAGHQIFSTERKKKPLFSSDTPEDEKLTALDVHDSNVFLGNEGGSVEMLSMGSTASQASSKQSPTQQTEPCLGSKFEHMPSVGGMLSPLRRSQVVTQLLPLWKERYSQILSDSALDALAKERVAKKERSEKKLARRRKGIDSDDDTPTPKEFKEVWGAGNPSDMSQLARRYGDHDNGISALKALGPDSAVAATTGGEVLMVKQHSDCVRGLRIFEKCYAGCVEAAEIAGALHLFAGNRGYDAEKYEVVVMLASPMTQLHRVTFEGNAFVSLLHWSTAAGGLLVGQEDKGLFLLRVPEVQPEVVFLSQEDPDTLNDESILGFAEMQSQLFVRTSFGRLRRFKVSDGRVLAGQEELNALRPSAIAGIQGRLKCCFNRISQTLYGVRPGYSEYKMETARPGDKEWRQHRSFPMQDGSGDVEVVPDGAPENGMGYAGGYRIKGIADGVERVVQRDELGGLMQLRKGWPPAFVAYVEIPGDGMVIVGGELGGLVRWKETAAGAFEALHFQGGRVATGGDCSYAVREACAAADSMGGLILALGNSAWVYNWSDLTFHGELPMKGLRKASSLPLATHLTGGEAKAWIVTWSSQDSGGKVFLWDLRSLTAMFSFGLDAGDPGDPALLQQLHGASDLRVFLARCPKSAKQSMSTLTCWSLQPKPVARHEVVKDFTATERIFQDSTAAITSLLHLPDVGLLVGQVEVAMGISIWSDSGELLHTIFPPRVGTSVCLCRGPGSRSAVWSVVQGGIGLLSFPLASDKGAPADGGDLQLWSKLPPPVA